MLQIDVGLKIPKSCNYPLLSFDSAEVEYELLQATINYANTFLQFRQPSFHIKHYTSCTVTLAIYNKVQKEIQKCTYI